jgi:hypothetical protein
MAHQYTLGADETHSEGVYNVVAMAKDCSPLELPPLAETIDPDALDALLAGSTARISFRYCGYEVVATGDEIQVQTVDSQ